MGLLSSLFCNSTNYIKYICKNRAPTYTRTETITEVAQPAVEPQEYEFETDASSWETASLNHEIKIDRAGLIYFKIDRRWVLQEHITGINFVKN